MASRRHELQSANGAIPSLPRTLPAIDAVGLTDARVLPDESFSSSWSSIVLPEGEKERLARTAAVNFVIRQRLEFEQVPLHGVILLVGPPGTGKTTLARGLADRVARMLDGFGQFAFLEINPHALASSSLGRSQQAVEQLFSTTIAETANGGPLVVLIDEVETIVTDRGQLSFESNPADVHRAVDAALVGLDHVARRHPEVLFVATSNFPQAIDDALMSRADLVMNVALPDRSARRAILNDVLEAFAAAYPEAHRLLDPALLDKAADISDGLDGRRLRKIIAAAAGRSEASTVDPGQLTGRDLLDAIMDATGREASTEEDR